MLATGLPGSDPSSAAAALPRRRLIVNVLLFQAGWFACVYAAARGEPLWGTACALVVMGWHLHVAARPAREAWLIAWVLAIGLVFDSLVLQLGFLHYASGQIDPRLAPHWIVALWGLFATSLNVSLRWLKGRWLLAAVLGAIAAPLSYAGGVRIGAASFIDAPHALITLAIGWAVLMPLLMALSDRFDGILPGQRHD